MHGNVAEWPQSVYRPYPYDPADGRSSASATIRGRACRTSAFRWSAIFLIFLILDDQGQHWYKEEDLGRLYCLSNSFRRLEFRRAAGWLDTPSTGASVIHTDGDRESVGPKCGGCQGCPTDEKVSQTGLDAPLAGGALVFASIGFFLGPLGMAVLGATWFDHSGASQLAGAVAGLAAGMLASVAVGRLLARVGKEKG